MANNSVKTGGILAGAGCLFGLAPLAISFAAAGLGSDIGNTLHWYTFFTAPAGAVVVIVGLVMAIIGASKSTASDFDESVTSTPGQGKAVGTGTPSDAKPVELPPLPSGLARIVKIAYAFGFVVLLVSCVMRVIVFQPFSGILTLFDLVPVFFAGWLVGFSGAKRSRRIGVPPPVPVAVRRVYRGLCCGPLAAHHFGYVAGPSGVR